MNKVTVSNQGEYLSKCAQTLVACTIFAVGFLWSAQRVAAETPIYRVERNGIVEYSSKPKDPSAKPADLPKLGRWKPESPHVIQLTCSNHGGINCARGADTDGSVICFDSYRDSIQRFAFECSTAKLEIMSISKPDDRGIFTVAIRNNKAVAARKIRVTFAPRRMESAQELAGP